MIKKVIGIIVAFAAIVVIIIATLHNDRFSSLVFDNGVSPAVVETSVKIESEPALALPEEKVISDTIAKGPLDSLQRSNEAR